MWRRLWPRRREIPRLATMTQEDLVYEVLKECFDPEIPLNVVDLGLIYDVKVNPDSVDLKITMTSPQCPSHVSISEDIKTRLTDAGFPTPKIELVWEPAWSPQRISEAGRTDAGDLSAAAKSKDSDPGNKGLRPRSDALLHQQEVAEADNILATHALAMARTRARSDVAITSE